MEASSYHTPVLLQETLSFLLTTPDGLYVDCTLGGGGHAEGLLQSLRGGRVFGVDRDADAIASARSRLSRFGPSFVALRGSFRHVRSLLAAEGVGRVHGVLLDLGVSSRHLDDPERGFSFMESGPLDMRMDRSSSRTAADVVNGSSEAELTSLLRAYGEERQARAIARAIVRRRPLGATRDLADAVADVVSPPGLTKSLARVFQAVRIEVNAELDELRDVLHGIPELLHSGGRAVVIAYHSLEDRLVKETFRDMAATRAEGVSRFLPAEPRTPVLRLLTKKPVTASEEEIGANPRSRSAKLRAAERT